MEEKLVNDFQLDSKLGGKKNLEIFFALLCAETIPIFPTIFANSIKNVAFRLEKMKVIAPLISKKLFSDGLLSPQSKERILKLMK